MMPAAVLRARGVAPALLAFAVPTFLYLTWPSFAYSGDDLQYANAIQEQVDGYLYYCPGAIHLFESGLSERRVVRPLPVNPRYLLEESTSVLVGRAARAAAWVALPVACETPATDDNSTGEHRATDRPA